MAKNSIIHGVLLEIFTIGTLITGSAGIGKSETALALIDRGHQLIADDAPEFSVINSKQIVGSCPELIQDFLATRDIGILNIKNLYGKCAIKPNTTLQLCINLEQNDTESTLAYADVLGEKIPQINIQCTTTRNYAVLIEAAVRNFQAQQHGYDANTDFAAKQQLLLQQTP